MRTAPETVQWAEKPSNVAGVHTSLSRSGEAWRGEEIVDRVTVPTQWRNNFEKLQQK
jgi:hypothetical protein